MKIRAGHGIAYNTDPGDEDWIELADSYGSSHSHQTVAADLELDAAVGTSAADSSAFLAPFMGNVIGDTLTKTKNYLAGVIGAFSVTGAKSTVLPAAAVLGIAMDGVTDMDGIIVGHIDGSDPSSQTRANAVFKATMANAHASSGVDYGLDLHAPAINIGSETEVAMPVAKADLRLSNETCVLQGSGAPGDGVSGTGAGFAGPGSLYIRNATTPKLYINTNTKASPTWTVVGAQS